MWGGGASRTRYVRVPNGAVCGAGHRRYESHVPPVCFYRIPVPIHQHWLAPVSVALKVKAFVPVFIASQRLSAACLGASRANQPSAPALRTGFLQSLDLTRRVMSLSVEARDLFDAMKGGSVVVGWLRDHDGDLEALVEVGEISSRPRVVRD